MLPVNGDVQGMEFYQRMYRAYTAGNWDELRRLAIDSKVPMIHIVRIVEQIQKNMAELRIAMQSVRNGTKTTI